MNWIIFSLVGLDHCTSVVLLPGSSIPAGYWAWFYPNLYAMVRKAHLAAIASTPAASVGEMEKDWTAVQRP